MPRASGFMVILDRLTIALKLKSLEKSRPLGNRKPRREAGLLCALKFSCLLGLL